MQHSIKYQRIQPPASLRDIVGFYWVFEGDFRFDNLYRQPTTATIFPKLSFQYEGMMSLVNSTDKEPVNIRSGFQGQTNKFQSIISHERVGVEGVCFFPHAIPLLFQLPSHNITNQNLSIDDLLGSRGRELEELIISAGSNSLRIQLLSEFLEKRLYESTPHKYCLASAIQKIWFHNGQASITQLASDSFLSQRQFERKFKEQLGFTPKMFSRIVRFENCIAQQYSSYGSLTELAYLSGYYDQSHFNRDFKEFSGKSPGEYFSYDLAFFFE